MGRTFPAGGPPRKLFEGEILKNWSDDLVNMVGGVFLCAFVLFSCAPKRDQGLRGLEILSIRGPAPKNVRYGTISEPLEVMDTAPLAVETIKRAVSRSQVVLRSWAQELTGIEVKEFRYTFTAKGVSSGRIIVRYFAETLRRNQVYAGVQALFVVSNDGGTLEALLFAPVPFER